MFDRIRKAVQTLEQELKDLDPDILHPKDAPHLLALFSKVEKLGAAGKALAAGRVAQSGAWRTKGDRSPAHFVSRTTGDSIGAALTAIHTAQKMADLPIADRAFRRGDLTPQAAAEIASAATLVPDKQTHLLQVAQKEGIAGLRTAARRVIAQTCSDERQRAERLHSSRYLRTFTDPDGAFRLDARMTPEAGAQVKTALDHITEDLHKQAIRHGAKDSYQALQADALVQMAKLSHTGQALSSPRALVNVRVDHAALKRGHVTHGEMCEIPGVGPISVDAARALASDSILKVLVCKGTEIKAVATYGRTIPTKLRTALIETYPECAVQGCRETKGLEIDHVVPLCEGGPTAMSNTTRLCSRHHALKTYKGFRLIKDQDGWQLLPPPARTRAGPGP